MSKSFCTDLSAPHGSTQRCYSEQGLGVREYYTPMHKCIQPLGWRKSRKAVQIIGYRGVQPRGRPGFVLQVQVRMSQDTQRWRRGRGVTLHFAVLARAKQLRRPGEEATPFSLGLPWRFIPMPCW